MKNDAKFVAVLEQQNRYLQALLALLVRQPSVEEALGGKVELLLAEFGLGNQEIAAIVDKKPDAVRMLIKRHKQQKTNK